MTERSALGNAVRATVLVHGRAELHLKFNNREELEQAYRELDVLEGKPAPTGQRAEVTDEQIGQWLTEAQSKLCGAIPQARYVIRRALAGQQSEPRPDGCTERPCQQCEGSVIVAPGLPVHGRIDALEALSKRLSAPASAAPAMARIAEVLAEKLDGEGWQKYAGDVHDVSRALDASMQEPSPGKDPVLVSSAELLAIAELGMPAGLMPVPAGGKELPPGEASRRVGLIEG